MCCFAGNVWNFILEAVCKTALWSSFLFWLFVFLLRCKKVMSWKSQGRESDFKLLQRTQSESPNLHPAAVSVVSVTATCPWFTSSIQKISLLWCPLLSSSNYYFKRTTMPWLQTRNTASVKPMNVHMSCWIRIQWCCIPLISSTLINPREVL